MAEAPQNGRTGDESTEYRPHETTVHYGPEFAAQLAAMEAGISPEELDSDVTVAGRHPDADIFLDDVTVSRKHASFLRHGSQFSMRDLGSLNGTFMAGERIEETVPLVDGSEVQVGKFHLTFYASRHDLPSSA